MPSQPKHRVFVHVGQAKTGTTYLQDLLKQHRPALRSKGLLYPRTNTPDHFLPALDARGDHVFLGEERVRAAGAWARLVTTALRFDGDVVLGHEILATARADAAQVALRMFDEREVHVLVTVRDPARQLLAVWQEGLKHRRHHDFADYLRLTGFGDDQEVPPVRSPDDPRPFSSHHLVGVLDAWCADLPPEQVHVITVPQSGTDPSLLWNRFLGVCGEDASLYPAPAGHSVRRNVSLGVNDSELLRRVNEALGAELGGREYGAVVKEIWAQKVLGAASPDQRMALPEHQLRLTEQMAASWIDTIRDRGYAVAGSLDELRPTPTQGRQPGSWTEVEVLAAAIRSNAGLLRQIATLRAEAAAIDAAADDVFD
ncbi:MAG: hypothetical protein ACRDP1_16310 [Nocardioidaceae bacterium]